MPPEIRTVGELRDWLNTLPGDALDGPVILARDASEDTDYAPLGDAEQGSCTPDDGQACPGFFDHDVPELPAVILRPVQ